MSEEIRIEEVIRNNTLHDFFGKREGEGVVYWHKRHTHLRAFIPDSMEDKENPDTLLAYINFELLKAAVKEREEGNMSIRHPWLRANSAPQSLRMRRITRIYW